MWHQAGALVAVRYSRTSLALLFALLGTIVLFWPRAAHAQQPCPCSLWTSSAVPGPLVPDPNGVELGIKFRADTDGFVTAVRFYKYAQNTGTHVGHLWTASGTSLGSVTFTNEAASGWQQATFATPIAITANTTYVASYFTPTGHYAANEPGLPTAIDNPPLHALADGTSGGNGVYRYSSSSVFPNQTYNASNYWVDVVFVTIAGDTTPPTVTAVTPANGATGVAGNTALTVTFSEAMTASTITTSTILLRDSNNTIVAATVSYNATTLTATLMPSAALTDSTTYTGTVTSGSTGVEDASANALASDFTWSFTTGPGGSGCPCSIWSLTTTPGPVIPDAHAVELGVKFRADTDGFITGVRFYKYAQNTGTHIGHLWTTSGTSLGSVTFTNETASGWQQATFATPIAVTANTTHVASYFTPTGYYAFNSPGLATAVDNAPLHALADGVSGGNGVYRYSSSSVFPNQTYGASNYWVDVVFTTAGGGDTTPPTVTGGTPANGATGVATNTAVTVTFNEAMTASTISTSTILLRNPANTVIAATVNYNATTLTATLTPSTVLANATTYTGTVVSGSSGVRDASGNALASPFVWSFTTASAGAGCPCSIWSPTTTPGPVIPDAQAVELGVKFRADSDGFITGVRFYKYAQNTGTHVGHLWTTSGTSLGSVTFTSETASGWQQATFASPVAITANTTYVVSYHTNTGYYAATDTGLSAAADNPPLHALSSSSSGGNGVYRYSSSSVFPNQTYSTSNYWVDVVFTTNTADTLPPSVATTLPSAGGMGVSPSSAVTAMFSEPVDATTISASTFELRTATNQLVSATVAYNAATWSASLVPLAPLSYASTYVATVKTGVRDPAGNALAAPASWSFTTASATLPPTQGAGGPILIVTSTSNPFTQFYAEILRTEGLNEFATLSLSQVTATVLSSYDVVILGEQTLTSTQVTMFTNWVQGGGNLIALRPDKKLATLLGFAAQTSTLANAYLQIDSSQAAGAGLVSQTMQFHGTADEYVPAGATVLATLYSDSTHATAYPAVTLNTLAGNGGQAAAFTYDLARSVVHTRQGNPSWAGQERDGSAPIRSDDLFYGAKAGDIKPDWTDPNRLAIPQADEQQRLLANLILLMNGERRPLPRFWYFPRGDKAVVVMTGDDHANGGTASRFAQYLSASPANCNVDNWECIRGSAYIYPTTPITDAEVASFLANGFDVGVHVTMDPATQLGCGADFTPTTLANAYSSQIASFTARFPSASGPSTHRMHCIMWSDWSSQPQTEGSNGIRLDTTYYYWPPWWINDTPGFLTGSGMPMRYAKLDGSLIDVYQAATQMTDESEQSYPMTVDTLLDNALGSAGYYGAFTANMHNDYATSAGANAILASAAARHVPIVSAKQMLTWLDGRNSSTFGPISWSGSALSFSVVAGSGANGLQVMVPTQAGPLSLTAITLDGVPVDFTTETVKGLQYAFVTVAAGTYVATYEP